MNKYLPKIIGSSINLVSYVSPDMAGNLAMLLFSTPQKGKSKNIESDFLKTAIQKKIPYNNTSIATYHWKGEKETILLVHGWESNSHRWKKLVENLKPLGYNIVALDAPAHGKSGGKRFNAIVYAEFISVVVKTFKPTIIIGHSVGGMAAIISQFDYGLTSIEKTVLLGAPSNFTGIFNRYKKMMRYNKEVSEAIDHYVFKKFNQQPSYYHIENFSEGIHSKGLIIHDKKDKIIPYSDALDYQRHYKNSELISTTGLGHGLKDKTINDHILKFINQ